MSRVYHTGIALTAGRVGVRRPIASLSSGPAGAGPRVTNTALIVTEGN